MKRIKNLPNNVPQLTAACALVLALAACDSGTPPKAAAPVAQPAAATAAQPAPVAKAEAPKPDPDAELAAKVKSAFAGDAELKMLPIDIRATNGAVTLYGTAENAKLRDKAVRIASGVEGVRSVNNNVQIVKGS